MTLSALLQKHCAISAEAAEKLLGQGSVWDNDRKARLKDGDMVIRGQLLRVDRPKFKIREFALEAEDVKFEDDHLLIVYKRGGVPVQPTPYSDTDNLLHGVQKYYDEKRSPLQGGAHQPPRPAGPGAGFFRQGQAQRGGHEPPVPGAPGPQALPGRHRGFPGVQPSYIIRSDLEWQGSSKAALTYVRFCAKTHGRFFFLVFPQTGRTHQIRRHFQEQVAPLLGDVRYGGAPPGRSLWLLCFRYSFLHPLMAKKSRSATCPKPGGKPWGWSG